MGILRSDSFHASINKLSVYTSALQDYENDKENLIRASNSSDSFEKSSIERALDLLEKSPPLSISAEFSSIVPNNGFYYFYQLSDSQPYFLHPLNTSMLKRQLGEYENFPLTLNSKIIEIERIHITEHEQRKHG